MLKLGQAIRNAIELEQAAARFYDVLAAKAGGADVRGLLIQLAAQEREHATLLETFGAQLATGELPLTADADVSGVETAPGWGDAAGLGFDEAIELAIEAENGAALYYDAIADFCSGEGAAFFRRMVAIEEQHAERLLRLTRPAAAAATELVRDSGGGAAAKEAAPPTRATEQPGGEVAGRQGRSQKRRRKRQRKKELKKEPRR